MTKTVTNVWIEFEGYDILFRKGWSQYQHQYIIRIIRPDGSEVAPLGAFGPGISVGVTNKSAGKYAREMVAYDQLPQAEKDARATVVDFF